MLEYFGRVLTGFISVISIILILAAMLLGGLAVGVIFQDPSAIHYVLGVIIGFAAGFFTDVLLFGMLGIFVEMRNSLQSIDEKLDTLINNTNQSE